MRKWFPDKFVAKQFRHKIIQFIGGEMVSLPKTTSCRFGCSKGFICKNNILTNKLKFLWIKNRIKGKDIPIKDRLIC